MSGNMTSVKRRRLLKRGGAAVASSGSLIGISSARNTGKTEFVGISYDPVTLTELGTLSGQFARNAQTLQGHLKVNSQTLDVPQTRIPLALDTPKAVHQLNEITSLSSNAITSDFDAFLGGSFAKNGRPLHLRISSQLGGYVSGVIQRPGDASNAIAFVLGENTSAETVTSVRNQIRNQLARRQQEK